MFVYLYFTEAIKGQHGQNETIANRVYRYVFDGNHLIEPKLLLDLPAIPGPYHNGGKLNIGPENNLYVVVGDLGLGLNDIEETSEVQNNNEGTDPDGRAGILRVTQDGKPILKEDKTGVLGDKYPLNLYYAYGIRNSFGIDFDPVTGYLWDTENGEIIGDEINLVKP